MASEMFATNVHNARDSICFSISAARSRQPKRLLAVVYFRGDFTASRYILTVDPCLREVANQSDDHMTSLFLSSIVHPVLLFSAVCERARLYGFRGGHETVVDAE